MQHDTPTVKVKIKTFITVLLILFGLTGISQNYTPKDSIEIVKTMIRTKGSVESMTVGGHPKYSKQCIGFLFLIKRLNIDDLIALTYDSSVCLRIYAYASLLHKNYTKVKGLKLRLEKDTSQIFFIENCVGGTTKIKYILKSVKRWETKKLINAWFNYYTESESVWINYLFQT